MAYFTKTILATLTIVHLSWCWSRFKDYIPNGNKVPNPCSTDPSSMWSAVGHLSPGNGGPRNPFGKDFKLENLNYTIQLNNMDSDGDGVPNGLELGIQVANGVFYVTGNPTGHPGICEPVNSENCMRINTENGIEHPCPRLTAPMQVPINPAITPPFQFGPQFPQQFMNQG